jgi:DNA adenine methylase
VNVLPSGPAKLNSPFRYPGGKFYARKRITPRLPAHANYCELFCGGSSIFFYKPKAAHTILNDLDGELINCLLHVRDRVEAMIDALQGVRATKANHALYKASRPGDDLGRAVRWYFLNRVSYSGIMKTENCYWGYGAKYSRTPERWPANLRAASEKLQGVEITCRDFRDVLRDIGSDYFLFIDPPYYGTAQGKFYTHAFTKKDHDDLCTLLIQRSEDIKFFLTYDNHPEVWKLYGHWCNVLKQEWGYAIQRTDDQRNDRKLADGHQGRRSKGRELFVTN